MGSDRKYSCVQEGCSCASPFFPTSDFRFSSSSHRQDSSFFGEKGFYRPNVQFQKSQESYNPIRKRVILCFRCGNKNHKAKDCSNQIRCFNCGVFGHKRKSCPKLFNLFHFVEGYIRFIVLFVF